MTLYESLMKYPRVSLLEIARLKGLRGVSRLHKDDLVSCLTKYMLSPEGVCRYFQWLKDDEIAMLPEAPELIAQSEFAVRAYDEEDGTERFFVLPEVMEVYRNIDTSEFQMQRRRHSFLLSCLKVVDAWYGAAPLEVMMQLAAKAPELEITPMDLLTVLDELPGELQHYRLLDGMVCHCDILDVEQYLLEDQKNIPYYIPTRDEIENLAKMEALPETEGVSELLHLLTEKESCTAEDAEELVYFVTKGIAAGCSIRSAIELLEPYVAGVTDAEKIMLVDPICRIYENTRLLILRGHTRKELGIEF